MADKSSKIFLAGHNGMVGSAIYRNLTQNNYTNIIIASHEELDLRRQSEVDKFFIIEKPEVVIIAAAKVGGILANNIYRADFIYDNLMIASNLIGAAHKYGVEKLIFLGSSCIYPKMAKQPIKEEELLNGYLEYTNEPYAIAKIAGIKLCESFYRQYNANYFSVMPCNLYGPYDNFDLKNSHVLPALLRKFHEAVNIDKNKKNGRFEHSVPDSVTVWGTGEPEREFLYVEDLASAVRFMLENVNASDIYEEGISHLNVGSGSDVTISRLAHIIAGITKYEGEIVFDASRPDGTPKKLMDSSRINKLGWRSTMPLAEGIRLTYDWYKAYRAFYDN